VREKNKVMLGQVKASALNNKQNKGTVEALFSEEKNFYKDFGLIQIVDSIGYIKNNTKSFEVDFPENEIISIYPIIVFNDPICSTPILPMLFQEKLSEYLKHYDISGLDIKPITLIHIQEIEILESYLKEDRIDIWKLLHDNFEDSLFPKPFRVTLSRNGIQAKETDSELLAKYIGLDKE
jgi:hypothetical protein